jgi:hypothetical protein
VLQNITTVIMIILGKTVQPQQSNPPPPVRQWGRGGWGVL